MHNGTPSSSLKNASPESLPSLRASCPAPRNFFTSSFVPAPVGDRTVRGRGGTNAGAEAVMSAPPLAKARLRRRWRSEVPSRQTGCPTVGRRAFSGTRQCSDIWRVGGKPVDGCRRELRHKAVLPLAASAQRLIHPVGSAGGLCGSTNLHEASGILHGAWPPPKTKQDEGAQGEAGRGGARRRIAFLRRRGSIPCGSAARARSRSTNWRC